MIRRSCALLGATILLAACASWKPPLEQRTTQGPTAEEFWTYRVVLMNGRQPNFDERRHWTSEIDERITRYLQGHPEDANSLDVSTFRFYRRAAVGQSKEQVAILLGPPAAAVTDRAQMEELARKFWPMIKGAATEVWVYPLGWRFYFDNKGRVVDITQYLER